MYALFLMIIGYILILFQFTRQEEKKNENEGEEKGCNP